jgi:hypothetical protein
MKKRLLIVLLSVLCLLSISACSKDENHAESKEELNETKEELDETLFDSNSNSILKMTIGGRDILCSFNDGYKIDNNDNNISIVKIEDSNDINVVYSDSGFNLHDEGVLTEKWESFQNNYLDTAATVTEVNKNHVCAFKGINKDDGSVYVEMYEEIPGATSCLKIQATAYNDKMDADDLLSTFTLIF